MKRSEDDRSMHLDKILAWVKRQHEGLSPPRPGNFYGEILPRINVPEGKRLQSMINLFRWGDWKNPKDIQLERLEEPVDLSPDWLPPEHRLLEREEQTGRIIIGLEQFVDDEGIPHYLIAWPLVEAENESVDHRSP